MELFFNIYAIGFIVTFAIGWFTSPVEGFGPKFRGCCIGSGLWPLVVVFTIWAALNNWGS